MSQPCRKLKKICCLVIAFLAVIVVTGGSHGQASAESGGAPLEALSICVGGTPSLPVLLAHEQGLFIQEGLEVTVKQYLVGLLALEAMFAGECDMATVAETPVVMKSFERQDFSIVATTATSDDATRVLANKERGIQRPEDLKGKRIFVHKNTINHFFVEMFLARIGLSAKDVTLIYQDVEDFSEAITKGTIDAFVGTDLTISKPRKALGDQAVIFNSPGLCLMIYNLAVKNSVIKERPQLVKSVLRALLKGEDVFAQKRPQAITALAKATNCNEHDMAATLAAYRWQIELSQTMLLSLEQEALWAIDSGLTNKTRIPNYLDFIYRDALFSLRPEAVTMLK
jgi:NitT/TauT family transport system substrate-binding protein